jgi:hypothetical protein
MHRALLVKLREDAETFLARARRNIAFHRECDPDGHSEFYTSTWERLLNGSLKDLEAAMVSTSQESRDLRQASPFAGTLSDEERWDVLEQVYQDLHPDASQETLNRIAMLRHEAPLKYRQAVKCSALGA